MSKTSKILFKVCPEYQTIIARFEILTAVPAIVKNVAEKHVYCG